MATASRDLPLSICVCLSRYNVAIFRFVQRNVSQRPMAVVILKYNRRYSIVRNIHSSICIGETVVFAIWVVYCASSVLRFPHFRSGTDYECVCIALPIYVLYSILYVYLSIAQAGKCTKIFVCYRDTWKVGGQFVCSVATADRQRCASSNRGSKWPYINSSWSYCHFSILRM